MGSVGAWLLQAASGADVVRQSTTGGGSLEVIAIIAIAVIGLVLIALLAVLIVTVLELRKAAAKIEATVDRVSGKLDPVIGHARNIADNADYISTVVRGDVGKVSGTLTRANDSLNTALDATDRRMKELAALLRIFQDEVEQTLVSGTSMLRGLRVGAHTLRDDAIDLFEDLEDLEDEPGDFIDEPDDLVTSGTILDSDELDDEVDDTLEDAEETDDGYEWARDGGDGGDASAERPRIRRRPPR
jgi:diacylglycerol kinase